MTAPFEHLTAARNAAIEAYGWLFDRHVAQVHLRHVIEHLDDALADAEPNLPEGWVEVRVPLSSQHQRILRTDWYWGSGTHSALLRDALVSQHPEPERPLQPGDIVCFDGQRPTPDGYVWRVEAIAHGQAWLTASDDGLTGVEPVEDLVRVDAVPDSVDTSWHDAHPIDRSQP